MQKRYCIGYILEKTPFLKYSFLPKHHNRLEFTADQYRQLS